MSRVLIVTDAWRPQINGVVRTLERLSEELVKLGEEVEFLTPADFRTLPCPTYPEIRLSLTRQKTVARRIAEIAPDYIHIATEGPLGLIARRIALKTGRGYTTSYHTRFPEYLRARLPVPLAWSYAWLRRFHNSAAGCLVATESLRAELTAKRFKNLLIWSRGVDTDKFHPREGRPLDLPRPVFLHVGRVAVEKNLEAFLKLDLPGSKLVVGGGPQLDELKVKYPDVTFTGAKTGEELYALYSMGDVFVFPSLTDTFGNVVVEALASGVPVAAFPVTGPLDIIGDSGAGRLGWDLRQAAIDCLALSRETARAHALTFSWEASARQFMECLRSAQGVRDQRADAVLAKGG
ncbi:MAG: glycosyltransferase family 1 protein [Hyphomicrobiaceae bacterium]|nr:glycosyltransferase family 1 protein [Hyphomicrobiaceae bacterium]